VDHCGLSYIGELQIREAQMAQSGRWDGVSELAVVRRIDQAGGHFITVVWADPGSTLAETVKRVVAGIRSVGNTAEVLPIPQTEIVRRFRLMSRA